MLDVPLAVRQIDTVVFRLAIRLGLDVSIRPFSSRLHQRIWHTWSGTPINPVGEFDVIVNLLLGPIAKVPTNPNDFCLAASAAILVAAIDASVHANAFV